MLLIERKCTDDPGLNTTVWDPIKTAVLEGTRMQADRRHVDLIYSAFIFVRGCLVSENFWFKGHIDCLTRCREDFSDTN